MKLKIITTSLLAWMPVLYLYNSQPVASVAVCPPDTVDGAYTLQGYDDDGTPICTLNYFNQCPYANSVSANDPICLKLAPKVVTESEPEVAPVQPKKAETPPKTQESAKKSQKTQESAPIQQNKGCINHGK